MGAYLSDMIDEANVMYIDSSFSISIQLAPTTNILSPREAKHSSTVLLHVSDDFDFEKSSRDEFIRDEILPGPSAGANEDVSDSLPETLDGLLRVSVDPQTPPPRRVEFSSIHPGVPYANPPNLQLGETPGWRLPIRSLRDGL